MVKKSSTSVAATVLLSLSLISVSSTVAEARQEIRLYKINKQEQSDRVRFTGKKGRKPGCHNFLKKVRVHRVVQIGYKSCTIYTEKACETGTEIKATRAKEPGLFSTLTEGYSWFPEPDTESKNNRGVKLKSWFCE